MMLSFSPLFGVFSLFRLFDYFRCADADAFDCFAMPPLFTPRRPILPPYATATPHVSCRYGAAFFMPRYAIRFERAYAYYAMPRCLYAACLLRIRCLIR